MEEINIKQEDIRRRAEHLMHRTEELISVLDNWMPSDEANANMEREIIERRRKEQEASAVIPACPPKSNVWKRLLKKLKINFNSYKL